MSVPSTTLSPNPWARILDALEKKINRHSYDTWLKPTRYSHSSGGILFVPTLTLALGLTQLHAEASSLLAIIPTVTFAVLGAIQQHLQAH